LTRKSRFKHLTGKTRRSRPYRKELKGKSKMGRKAVVAGDDYNLPLLFINLYLTSFNQRFFSYTEIHMSYSKINKVCWVCRASAYQMQGSEFQPPVLQRKEKVKCLG
jgi:hypothetical protein